MEKDNFFFKKLTLHFSQSVLYYIMGTRASSGQHKACPVH